MKKKEILRKSDDFSKVIRQKNKIYNKYFNTYYMPAMTIHFGITVPKKIGNAVMRNKIKRRIKSIIDHNEKIINFSANYVIIIKKEVLEINYQKLEEELVKVFIRISKGEKNEKENN